MSSIAMVVAGAAFLGLAGWRARDLPHIWWGERLYWLPLPGSFFDVTQRSFAIIVFSWGAFGAAALLVGLLGLSGAAAENASWWGAGPIVALAGLGMAGVVLSGVIEATNRPRFLVPPPLRNQPGSITAGRHRRNRTRRGQPETDHEVMLMAVPPANGSGDTAPFWIAVCDEPDCTWQSDTVVASGAEAAVRSAGRRHSSRYPKVEHHHA